MGTIKKLALYGLPVLAAYYYFFGCCGGHFDPEAIRGKRVLVTGASSGIGEQVALKYAELGAQVVITARRKELLEKVAEKCKKAGAEKVVSVVADMALPADRKKVVEATLKELGGLDFLILNHALMDFSFWKGTAENMTKLEKMTAVNFISFVDLTSGFLKALEASKGHIGVVSSVAGKFGSFGMATYCATKHALQGFFSSLRQELKYRKTGVSVTLVVFGPVESDKALEIMETIPARFNAMDSAASTQDAALELIKGVSAREYELFYPFLSTLMVKLNRMFPYLMDDYGDRMVTEGAQF